MSETRQCCRCDAVLPLEAFPLARGQRGGGRAYHCKACEAKRVSAFRAAHPEYCQREVVRVKALRAARRQLAWSGDTGPPEPVT